MKLAKIIITSDNKLFNLIIDRFNLKWTIFNDINIHKWINKNSLDKEDIILLNILEWNLNDTMNYLYDNFQFNKIIIVWLSNSLNNYDLKWWDVIIPNTFISSNDNNKPIFTNSLIWESYDLNKFWLLLNWICFTWEILQDNDNKEFLADIKDTDVFEILSFISNKNNLDKSVVIKVIEDNENQALIQNWVDVLELIL